MSSAESSLRSAEDFLNVVWRELRNDCGSIARARVAGALVALQAVGFLTAVEVEGWARRMEHCPGHDDEVGRTWCAFCGSMR